MRCYCRASGSEQLELRLQANVCPNFGKHDATAKSVWGQDIPHISTREAFTTGDHLTDR
jgi:hypothetical protein